MWQNIAIPFVGAHSPIVLNGYVGMKQVFLNRHNLFNRCNNIALPKVHFVRSLVNSSMRFVFHVCPIRCTAVLLVRHGPNLICNATKTMLSWSNGWWNTQNYAQSMGARNVWKKQPGANIWRANVGMNFVGIAKGHGPTTMKLRVGFFGACITIQRKIMKRAMIQTVL